MLLQKTRQLARGAILGRASRLLAVASPQTLCKMWSLFEKISSHPNDRREARRFRWLIEQGHPFGKWLQRISAELNPRARAAFVRNIYGHAWFLSRGRRAQFERQHGFEAPHIIVIDVTARCNLKCDGCWAALYDRKTDLPYDLLERAITEAEEQMGIHFFVFSGGEPTVRQDLYALYEAHPGSQFQLYTNGMLIDDQMAAEFGRLGNVMPMVSIEGDRAVTDARRGQGAYDRVMQAMGNLRRHGVLFGFSVTATSGNWGVIMTDQFIQQMIACGCLYGWYFQYIPVGRNPSIELMVTPQQREHLRKRIYYLRNNYPIFVVDFWNDGPEVQGCIAGGRRYFHINNNGDIEPCVFCHFAVDNIRTTTLADALKHPFFRAIREEIPYDGNLLRPCMLIDRPWVFRQHAAKYGARPTHSGAESLLTTLAEGLDQRANQWASIADKCWAARDYMGLYPYPPGDAPEAPAPGVGYQRVASA